MCPRMCPKFYGSLLAAHGSFVPHLRLQLLEEVLDHDQLVCRPSTAILNHHKPLIARYGGLDQSGEPFLLASEWQVSEPLQ